MNKKKSVGVTSPPPARRGRRKQKEHWLYDVEKALGLNHSDIARLLTPEPLSIGAVRDILNGRSNTPALQGLRFPVPAATVGHIISGDSLVWLQKAETLLPDRLGLFFEEAPGTGIVLRGYSEKGMKFFSKETVKVYLDSSEQDMRSAFGRQGSPFRAVSDPLPEPPENPKYPKMEIIPFRF